MFGDFFLDEEGEGFWGIGSLEEVVDERRSDVVGDVGDDLIVCFGWFVF